MNHACPRYRLTRTPIAKRSSFNFDGFNYDVDVEGREENGQAQLLFLTVGDMCIGYGKDTVYKGLKALGLKDSDVIGQLSKFTPNGKRGTAFMKKYVEHGIGSAVYKKIIKDAKKDCINGTGAKAMFVFTVQERMKDFLSHRNFTRTDSRKTRAAEYLKAL
jgi:hypothetical protein